MTTTSRTLTNLEREIAMDVVTCRADTDEACVLLYDLAIRALETLFGECAAAHYEPDCVCCEKSVIIRQLRLERDETLADIAGDALWGSMTIPEYRAARAVRADELQAERDAHEARLVMDYHQWADEYAQAEQASRDKYLDEYVEAAASADCCAYHSAGGPARNPCGGSDPESAS